MRTRDKVLVLLAIVTIAYTVTMIVLFWSHYAIPDTLTQCFFGVVTAELAALTGITITKVRHNDDLSDSEKQKLKDEFEEFRKEFMDK